jgi:hypothetical protein
MKPIIADTDLIAFCGLYCGACKKHLRETCPGCASNEKATWCKVRSCCLEHGYRSCADCTEVDDVVDCKLLNGFAAKVFAVFFRSNRPACLARIREGGYQAYADHMAERGIQSIPR